MLKSTEDRLLPYCYNEVEWINEGNTEKSKQFIELVFGEHKDFFSCVYGKGIITLTHSSKY